MTRRARHACPTGTYDVVFKTDLSKCAYQATETIIDDAGRRGRAPDERDHVRVRTRDAAGVAADRPFHLLVIC